MLRAFTVKHWDPEGTGSGCTVVVASSERLARLAVIEYLRGKPEGYRQCQSADLLEVEPHEDSHLSCESVDTSEPGVKLEYRMLSEAPFEEIVYFGFPEGDLADELDRLQSGENQGRGVSCVRTLVFYLRRKEFVAPSHGVPYLVKHMPDCLYRTPQLARQLARRRPSLVVSYQIDNPEPAFER